MATELDKLVVKIEADLSNLKKGMAEANKQVSNSSTKMSGSLKKFSNSLNKVSKTAVKVGAVLGVAFGALFVKGVIDVGIQVENLQIRLKALFGSAEEGTKAFEKMIEFAGKVPFTLNQIQSASGNLAVVAEDADELARILEITGNVAAVTGLDFQQTAEQIQRSFSGGIAAADVFRERGVRDLLGFSAGATVSAEQTAIAFEKVFGKGGQFGNMTDELSNTLTGTISMIKDKFMQFQLAVAESFFAEIKRQFTDLNKFLDANNDTIKNIGKEVGENLAKTVKFLVDNTENIKLFFIALAGAATLSALASLTVAIDVLNAAILRNPFAGSQKLKAIASGVIVLNNIGKTAEEAGKELEELVKQSQDLAESQGMLAELNRTKPPRITENFEIKRIMETIDKRLELEKREKQALINAQNKIKADLQAAKLARESHQQMVLREKMMEQQIEQERNLAIIKEVNAEARGKQFEEEMEEVAQLHKHFERMGQAISTAFGEAVISGKDFKDSMVDIFQSVAQQVVALIFQLRVMEPLLAKIRSAHESSQLFGGSLLKNLFSAGATGSLTNTGMIMGGLNGASMPMQGLAGGGSVNPNMPYMVGERGAEMFVPKSAGNIVNNNQLSGMRKSQPIIIEQNLNFATGVSQTVRAEVMNLLPAIQQSTLSAVQDARLRGGTFAKDFGA